MNKVIKYTAVLVATYLVVSNATGAGRLLTAGAGGYRTVVRTLQGK